MDKKLLRKAQLLVKALKVVEPVGVRTMKGSSLVSLYERRTNDYFPFLRRHPEVVERIRDIQLQRDKLQLKENILKKKGSPGVQDYMKYGIS